MKNDFGLTEYCSWNQALILKSDCCLSWLKTLSPGHENWHLTENKRNLTNCVDKQLPTLLSENNVLNCLIKQHFEPTLRQCINLLWTNNTTEWRLVGTPASRNDAFLEKETKPGYYYYGKRQPQTLLCACKQRKQFYVSPGLFVTVFFAIRERNRW